MRNVKQVVPGRFVANLENTREPVFWLVQAKKRLSGNRFPRFRNQVGRLVVPRFPHITVGTGNRRPGIGPFLGRFVPLFFLDGPARLRGEFSPRHFIFPTLRPFAFRRTQPYNPLPRVIGRPERKRRGVSDPLTPLLTPEDVAELLQVPKSWVYRQAREGDLPSVPCGRYVRFDRRDVDAWIDGRREGSRNGSRRR